MSVSEESERDDSELPDFLKRIQSGDEGAARELLRALRSRSPPGGSPSVAASAAIALRLARFPPERLGQFFPPHAKRRRPSSRIRGILSPFWRGLRRIK